MTQQIYRKKGLIGAGKGKGPIGQVPVGGTQPIPMKAGNIPNQPGGMRYKPKESDDPTTLTTFLAGPSPGFVGAKPYLKDPKKGKLKIPPG